MSIHKKSAVAPDGSSEPLMSAKRALPPLQLPSLPECAPPATHDTPLGLEYDAALPTIARQLRNLLHAPMHLFWSYALHDPTLLSFVDSVLRRAPRIYALRQETISAHAPLQEVVDLTLHVLLRLCTPQESPSLFLDAEYWRELVFSRSIFDAPKLVDVCALYGLSNRDLARRVVTSVLGGEPRYADQLAEVLGGAAEALSQCCGADPAQMGCTGAWALPVASAVSVQGETEAAELCAWLEDCVGTLHAVIHVAAIEVVATLSERLWGAGSLLGALQLVVEVALPRLRVVSAAAGSSDGLRSVAAHALAAAHKLLLEVVLAPLQRDAPKRAECDAALRALTWLAQPCTSGDAASAVKRLYERAGVPTTPCRALPEGMISGAGSLLQQLLVVCELEEPLRTACDNAASRAVSAAPGLGVATATLDAIRALLQTGDGGNATARATTPAEREALSTIKAMIPDEEDAFLLSALSYYGGSAAAVVDALLENNLPEMLKHEGRVQTSSQPPGLVPLDPPPAAPPQHVPPRGRDLLHARTAKKGARAHGTKSTRRLLPAAVATLYEDELDDSFEMLADSAAAIDDSADDLEAAASWTRAHLRAAEQDNEEAEGGRAPADARALLPRNALEWVRAIGLGQYEASLRRRGVVRLELAARIAPEDCERLGVSPRHADKLVSHARVLATRLERAGLQKAGKVPLDQSGYEAAGSIHFDEETGTWWGEDGSIDAASGDAESAVRGPPAKTAPTTAAGKRQSTEVVAKHPPQSKAAQARQRERKVQSKASVGNHNRKVQAARKHGGPPGL